MRLFEEDGHGRHASRLDRSHHHRRSCRLARRTIYEEGNGARDEYRARCHRGGGCQRHIELLWCPPWGMARLPDCWVPRRGLADLDMAGDRGTPTSLNRALLAYATHDCGGFGVVPDLRRALG